jgi:hemerythrin-like metal-binding protein
MTIEWTDAYKIGIPSLDDDHRKLVDITNHFFAQAESGANKPALSATLDEIVRLLDTHFQREEVLLDRHDYPDRLSHSATHRQQMLELQRFVESYKNGSLSLDLTVAHAEFLSQLLVKHIVEDDLPFKSAIRTLF